MKQSEIYKFFNQVYQEVKRVVWPERKELISSVVIVLIVVCLFSLITLTADYSIHNIIRFFLNIGK